MKLNLTLAPQQQQVFDYLLAHPNSTIDQIRKATKIKKPCMRISEINHIWRDAKGIPQSEKKLRLIITSGFNKYREAIKSFIVE